jgi:hypothetical protein
MSTAAWTGQQHVMVARTKLVSTRHVAETLDVWDEGCLYGCTQNPNSLNHEYCTIAYNNPQTGMRPHENHKRQHLEAFGPSPSELRSRRGRFKVLVGVPLRADIECPDLFFRNDQLGQGLELGHCRNAGVAYVRRALRPSSRRASPGTFEFSSGSLLWGTLLFGILPIAVQYGEVSKEEAARRGVSPAFKQCLSGSRDAPLCFQRDASTPRFAPGTT